MKGTSNYNQTAFQVYTLGNGTQQDTFTDEPAAGKVFHALADGNLTVEFIDTTPDLVLAVVAGEDWGFDDTVDIITTTAAGLLS